jgi:predicted Zn finger-like uncharacterized protein
MIITCQECTTRFNLDESVINAEGSKVRCSMCKHVFTVFPQVIDTPFISEPEEKLELDLPEETGSDEFDPDDFETDELEPDELDSDGSKLEFDEDQFDKDQFDETEFEIEDLDFVKEEPSDIDGIGLEMEISDKESADIEISFDPETDNFEEDDDFEFEEAELTFEDADIEFEDGAFEDDELEIEEEELSTDLSLEESGPELEMPQALEVESSDDQNMTFPDLSMEIEDPAPGAEEDLDLEFNDDPFTSPDPELEAISLDEELDLPNAETQFEEAILEPEDNFSSYDQVLDQDTEPEEDFQEAEMVDVMEEAPLEDHSQETGPEPDVKEVEIQNLEPDHTELDPGLPRRRKRKSAMGGPLMLLLFLFILVAGAYVASMTMGYKIPYLSDIKIPILEKYLKKEVVKKPAPLPIPNEGSVNGRFISNDTAGELFIITGRIENPAAIPYSYIQVKGTLITKGKVKATTQTIFCGNIISEEMLKTANISDISKLLSTREGSHNSNVNVKPGGFIPFMLVFSNLPDNLENFTVEVVAL